jgi:hypothetical protein
MQRLMLRADVPRIGMRRQRFDALAFDRQHQTAAVVDEAGAPIGMSKDFAQMIHVPLKLSEISHDTSTRLLRSRDNAMIFMTQ